MFTFVGMRSQVVILLPHTHVSRLTQLEGRKINVSGRERLSSNGMNNCEKSGPKN